MTIQELARVVVTVRTEDESTLQQWAEVENEAFEAYLSDYQAVSAVCKGCHEGGTAL